LLLNPRDPATIYRALKVRSCGKVVVHRNPANDKFWPVAVIVGLEYSRVSDRLEWQVFTKPDL
jgi:hypothetical protein